MGGGPRSHRHDAARLRRQPPSRDRQPGPRPAHPAGTSARAARCRTSGTASAPTRWPRRCATTPPIAGSTSPRVTRSSDRCGITWNGRSRCAAWRHPPGGLRRDSETAVRRRAHPRAGAGRLRSAEAAAALRSGTSSAPRRTCRRRRSSCPSFTLDQEELTKLDGAAFYEERLLFLLIRLRNPRAHVTYVTSQPVHPLILDYYLHLLAGVPASHARARLTMLCAYDSSPRPLTQKILERPRLIERIRAVDSQLRSGLSHRLQLDAARAQAGGAARHPAERPRSRAQLPRHQVGQPQGVPRGRRALSRRATRI